MWRVLLVGLLLSVPSLASANPFQIHYDIVVYNASTRRVVRVPVFHLQMSPHSQGFKKLMLRERKKLAGGEAIGYAIDGAFIAGDTFAGPRSAMIEPSPYPVGTPDNYPFPDDTKMFTYPYGYKP